MASHPMEVLGKEIQDSLLRTQSQPDMFAPKICMSFWYITYSHRPGSSYIENGYLLSLECNIEWSSGIEYGMEL